MQSYAKNLIYEHNLTDFDVFITCFPIFYTTFAEKSVEIKKNTYNYMIEIIEKYFPNLTEEQKKQFEALDALYRDWNSKINVISRKDIDNLYEHHVLHSLAIAKAIHFRPGTEILDFGCGGGFPGIPLAKEAAKTGGTACTAMNAANEEAVALYLQDRIGFYDIPDAVAVALRLPVTAEPSLDDIFEADRLARAYTRERFSDR